MAGVDPGFPIKGGANLPQGAPTYRFAKFSKKLHDIEKILGRRSRSTPPLPDPTNIISCFFPEKTAGGWHPSPGIRSASNVPTHVQSRRPWPWTRHHPRQAKAGRPLAQIRLARHVARNLVHTGYYCCRFK